MEHKQIRMSTAGNIQDEIAGSSNAPPQPTPPKNMRNPDIFKLDSDCCDEIFEYMKIKDLYSLAKTCTAFQNVTGEYLSRNNLRREIYVSETGSQLPGFNRFMTRIEIRESGVRYVAEHHEEFASVEYLTLTRWYDFNIIRNLHRLKKILAQIHTLEVKHCNTPPGFYLNIRKYCSQLKRLIVIRPNWETFDRKVEPDSWKNHEFSSIVDVKIIEDNYDDNGLMTSMEGIGHFLQRNGIRRFSTNRKIMNYKFHELLNSNAALETLKVDTYEFPNEILLNQIDQLHAKGFYKKLHLIIWNLYDELTEQIATLKGLDKLSVNMFLGDGQGGDGDWCPLPSIKELVFYRNVDTEPVAIACENVEIVRIGYVATNDDLLPFIRRCRKLHRFVISNFAGGPIDLRKLNKERGQLKGACKITICVKNDAYVETKWANINMNLSFIELKRGVKYN